MKVLDLFSGLGGFSKAFGERGHNVITVDIEPMFRPSIVADVRYLNLRGDFDVILASPPCDEFSKAAMPWHRDKANPEKGLELVYATMRIIKDIKPRFWVIENVRGAIKYFKPTLGNYQKRCGSRFLWGVFPDFPCDHSKCYGKWRLPPSPMRKALRSLIPYEISYNLCIAIEKEIEKEMRL